MKADPHHSAHNRQRDQASAPGVRRMPKKSQRDDSKAYRHDHLDGPQRNSGDKQLAAVLFGLDQLPGRYTEEDGDAGGKSAAEGSRKKLPSALKKIGERGKRKQ